MTKDSLSHPTLTVLEQTPIIIEKLLLGVPDATLTWKPSAQRWSIGEVLSHMTGVERVFRERSRRIIEEDSPALPSYDQNAAYAAGEFPNGGRELLRDFCHERDRTVTWMRYLPAESLGRTGEHAELGRITLNELWHEWAYHDLGHIRQISELHRSATFYPRMGGFQRYYTIKP